MSRAGSIKNILQLDEANTINTAYEASRGAFAVTFEGTLVDSQNVNSAKSG
jgi:hypothetical protein